MDSSVIQQIERLRQLLAAALRTKYCGVFGRSRAPATRSFGSGPSPDACRDAPRFERTLATNFEIAGTTQTLPPRTAEVRT